MSIKRSDVRFEQGDATRSFKQVFSVRQKAIAAGVALLFTTAASAIFAPSDSDRGRSLESAIAPRNAEPPSRPAEETRSAGPMCVPAPSGLNCLPTSCPNAQEECLPRCMHFDPATGFVTITDCDCVPFFECHAVVDDGPYTICIKPDAGGTADLPPVGCVYVSPDDDHMIIQGLPPGTTIQWEASQQILGNCTPGVCSFPTPPCDQPGGVLGGMMHCADTIFGGQMQGTGALAGYNRFIQFPVQIELHSLQLTGAPLQTFDTDMRRVFGQLPPGDPDFDLLRVTGGTDFGMPSPGHTTLTQLPGGNWAVDSFFDITYRIDFVGAPGGPLAGRSGSTTGTIRMRAGAPTPRCEFSCPPGENCERTFNYNPADGSWDICCECVPVNQVCEPLPSGAACAPTICPNPGQQCVSRCMYHDAGSGTTYVTDCECRSPFECHAVVQPGLYNLCIQPDSGGTVDLPPAGCNYISPDDDHTIIDGLPPGATLRWDAHQQIMFGNCQPGICSFPLPPCDQPGGTLGGMKHCADTMLTGLMQGTGPLAGYNRHMQVLVQIEMHSLQLTGAPVQTFDTDMFRMFGQIVGDPDFDLLRVVGGTDFGLPSPGHTTLTQLPGGHWAVDSFFDITYRIDFVGRPGGPFGGMSGSTTGTIRMRAGAPTPTCEYPCPPGMVCERTFNYYPGNGSWDICCDCVPIQQVCEPLPGGIACAPVVCPIAGEECVPVCARYFPSDNSYVIEECECKPVGECYLNLTPGPLCVVPDNGSGTADLPPEGCSYDTPQDDMRIIDGLPAGTTIEIDAVLTQFLCPGNNPGVCSFLQIPNVCQQPGGSLGGNKSCADAALQMPLIGTGALLGYNSFKQVPMAIEVHMGPRTLGDPVQSFPTDMFRMFGQITGDPDFDLLRIVGGTDFGLPSPGHTTLTRLGPPGSSWSVDSFFDITYRIDFVGAPGGPLAGRSGSTTGTVRFRTGGAPPECVGQCPPGTQCKITQTIDVDGSVHICCECVPCPQCPHDCAPAGGDGVISVSDINMVITNFGCVGVCPCDSMPPPCGDGQITISDINHTITQFGLSCP